MELAFLFPHSVRAIVYQNGQEQSSLRLMFNFLFLILILVSVVTIAI